ncbi:unnamed protein product [Closterium sp. NIES-64]|nr:unnamed protein product [Closterium sp. NIES-64]
MDGGDHPEGLKGGSPRNDAASPDRTLMRSAPPCSGEDSARADSAGADCAVGRLRGSRLRGVLTSRSSRARGTLGDLGAEQRDVGGRVVRVGGALVFLAEDFPHREAAERGITQALLQATAAVTSLYVEAPPASDPFQVCSPRLRPLPGVLAPPRPLAGASGDDVVPGVSPLPRRAHLLSLPHSPHLIPHLPLISPPPSLPALQELAVMKWCLACRDSLEELTLVDGTADAAIHHAQAHAAAIAAAAAAAAAAAGSAAAAAAAPPSAPVDLPAAARRNGSDASASATTSAPAAAGSRQGESERKSHGFDTAVLSIEAAATALTTAAVAAAAVAVAAVVVAGTVLLLLLLALRKAPQPPYHVNLSVPTSGQAAAAAAEEDEEVEEQPQEWKLEHASRCRNLRQLYLENAVFDCVSTLQRCSPFASLTHLTLAKAVVAGDMVGDLLACCPRLQELTLLLCSGIGPLDLMHAPCAELRRFEVRLSNRAARKDACLEFAPAETLPTSRWRLELGHSASHLRPQRSLCLGASRSHATSTRSRPPPIVPACPPSPFPQLTGDDWSWGTAPSLEGFQVEYHDHAMAVIAFLTALLLSSSSTNCINLRHLYLLPPLPPGAQLEEFHIDLEEFHVEYHDHAMAVIAFLTALLRGSPRLRCIQPMVTVPQEPGTDLLGDKDFRQAIARLQAEFPRVSFPSIWQLT